MRDISIKLNLSERPQIKAVQIDPNGDCNNRCWFCPLRYEDYPSHLKSTMPIDMIEKIVKQLSVRDGEFISKELNHIFTSHYNEISLYEHFKEMIEIFKKYNFKAYLYTNAVGLDRDKIDIIKRYKDSIKHIEINFPFFNPEDHKKLAGSKKESFYKTVDNIKNIIKFLPNLVSSGKINLTIFGVYNEEDIRRHRFKRNEHIINYEEYEKIFSGITYRFANNFSSRAGLLDRYGVVDYSEWRPKDDQEVFNCKHTPDIGGLLYGKIHINSVGDVFLCCNDFKCDYKFGNVEEKSLKEIWNSEDHLITIKKALNGICRECECSVYRRKIIKDEHKTN